MYGLNALNHRNIYIFLLTLGVVTISYFFLDRELALFIDSIEENRIKSFLISISFLGKSHWYIIPSLLLFFIFKKMGYLRSATFSLYVLYANLLAGIVVWLLKVPFGRLRPKMLLEQGEYGFEGLGFHYEYVSFPSGHSITIMATVTALAFIFPKLRLPLLFAGGMIAISRIAVNAHYYSDVIMGSYLGVMIALILYNHMIKDLKVATVHR
ncbi:MAG: phosphatase PAP2 family protein [Epsilonproteobacteria bacterium]|nr:phosphatase PAP2 family protein [Campylobacterota bacterium]